VFDILSLLPALKWQQSRNLLKETDVHKTLKIKGYTCFDALSSNSERSAKCKSNHDLLSVKPNYLVLDDVTCLWLALTDGTWCSIQTVFRCQTQPTALQSSQFEVSSCRVS